MTCKAVPYVTITTLGLTICVQKGLCWGFKFSTFQNVFTCILIVRAVLFLTTEFIQTCHMIKQHKLEVGANILLVSKVLLQYENQELVTNNHTIALISDASKILLHILKWEAPTPPWERAPPEQAGVCKGRGTRDHIANIRHIIEKCREFQKNL